MTLKSPLVLPDKRAYVRGIWQHFDLFLLTGYDRLSVLVQAHTIKNRVFLPFKPMYIRSLHYQTDNRGMTREESE